MTLGTDRGAELVYRYGIGTAGEQPPEAESHGDSVDDDDDGEDHADPHAAGDLAPGNRLDLDLVVPRAAAGTTFTVIDRFTRRPFTLATLKVNGPPVPTPDFDPPSNPNVPTWAGASERDVDVSYVLNARRGGEHGIQWTMGGPGGEHATTQFSGGRWVRIRFQNDSARLHPMHIHGQFFKVIARGGRPAEEPYFRDTVLLRPRETVDVGMVPIDWGKWMMHCHILEHAEAGMMTLVEVSEHAVLPR